MKKRLRSFPAAMQNARSFRKHPTIPERLLWIALRNRRLGGWKFRRQHPIDQFVMDFSVARNPSPLRWTGRFIVHQMLLSTTPKGRSSSPGGELVSCVSKNDRVLEDLAGALEEIRKAVEE